MPWAGILRVSVVIVLVWVVLIVAIWLGQRALIYHPDKSSPVLPAGAAEVTLRTGDGLALTAWEFAPSESADREAAVLVAPGNAGNRAGRVGLAAALAQEGFTVLLLDYRGFGGNPGSPSEQGLYEDARAAWDHLRGSFSSDRILLFGESLGSGVVAELSTQVDPGGLVLRSPFTSLADAGQEHYPLLPVNLLLRDRFPVVDRLESISAPIVVLYCHDDEVIPADQSRQVAKAAEEAGLSVTLIEIEASGHNDPDLVDGPDVIDGVTALADDLGLTATRR